MMLKTCLTVAFCIAATSVAAQIRVGITLSTTGPAASLGIPEKNTVALYPETIGGQKIEYVVMDDATDTTAARRNTEKFVADGVDVIIGSSTSPGTLAMIEVAAKSRTPVISLAAAVRLVWPMDDQKRWIFKMPYNDSIIAEAAVLHMVKTGIKTLGHIGFNDAYGESWYLELAKYAEKHGVKIVVSEKYNPKDTSVTAQALKIIAANPDAVMTVGSGTPAVLPQATLLERGYKGKFYQTSGVINNEFLRVGGKSVEGTLLPSGPVIVVDELPESHPARNPSLDYKKRYEAVHGPGTITTFGGNAWDAILVLQKAIPDALKAAKPGTVEFRSALRDAIESIKGLPATHGAINMTASDHNGFSADAPVIITIRNGKWALAR
ncbi:MAG: ABC transporter substrate-binding protein [Burkholderiaceae bacterium]